MGRHFGRVRVAWAGCHSDRRFAVAAYHRDVPSPGAVASAPVSTYTPADEQQLLAIRKTIIVAIASDDVLMERLTLKGGNALDIVYRLGERSSLDVDFSMAHSFEGIDDMAEMRTRLFRALRDRFDSLKPTGYVVFDEKLEQRPRTQPGQKPEAGLTLWGGYNATFKLIAKDVDVAVRKRVEQRIKKKFDRAPTDAELLRARQAEAQVTGSGSERVFYIEISKFEYTEGRVLRTVEDYDCYVYTPAMIAAEKLRAVCQQLPAYELRKHPAPRPRDFYDIHTIATRAGCDLAAPDHRALVVQMFAAKHVPLRLLGQLDADDVRAFHAQEWPAVQNAVRGTTRPFDFYLDFVVATARRLLTELEASGVLDSEPAA